MSSGATTGCHQLAWDSIITFTATMLSMPFVAAEARKWFDGGRVGEPPQPIPAAAPSEVSSEVSEDDDPLDVPAPSLTATTTLDSLPSRTFGAHHPACLAGMEEVFKDALPFKHIPGVGYVGTDVAKLLHAFATTGTCSEVARFIKESRTEEHYLEERLRLQLFLKAKSEKEVRTLSWLVLICWWLETDCGSAKHVWIMEAASVILLISSYIDVMKMHAPKRLP
jgi:hypothetical protein